MTKSSSVYDPDLIKGIFTPSPQDQLRAREEPTTSTIALMLGEVKSAQAYIIEKLGDQKEAIHDLDTRITTLESWRLRIAGAYVMLAGIMTFALSLIAFALDKVLPHVWR